MLTKILTEDDFSELRYRGKLNAVVTLQLDGGEFLQVILLEDEYIDSSRWTEIHRIVWRETDQEKILAAYYEVPATEMQEGSERDYDPAEVFEVVAEEITATRYTRVSSKAPEDMGA